MECGKSLKELKSSINGGSAYAGFQILQRPLCLTLGKWHVHFSIRSELVSLFIIHTKAINVVIARSGKLFSATLTYAGYFNWLPSKC